MHIINSESYQGAYDINRMIELAIQMIPVARKNTNSAQFPHYKAVLLFLERSTRTLYSSEQAVMNMGMRCTVIAGADHTSILKGESFADTIRMYVGQGARFIFLRTGVEGTPVHAAKIAQDYVGNISLLNKGPVSIINCGDGSLWHPTQYGLDFSTILHFNKQVDNFTLGALGDLLRGRTYKTNFIDFRKRPGMKFVHVAPEGFQLPRHFTKGVQNLVESDSLDALAECDFVYVTRFQMERLTKAQQQYIESIRHKFIINRSVLDSWKSNVKIMHPLPRVTEIAPEISTDPRIIAFQQAEIGITFRMAILATIAQGEYIPYLTPDNPKEIVVEKNTKTIDKQKPVKHFQPISNGTVLDGISAGKIDLVLRILRELGCIKAEHPLQYVDGVDSQRYSDNKKGVLLLHNIQLPEFAAAILQAMNPPLTVNYLPGDNTIIKVRFASPARIEGLTPNNVAKQFLCTNLDCITNHDFEARPSFLFRPVPSGELMVQCEYCYNPLWE